MFLQNIEEIKYSDIVKKVSELEKKDDVLTPVKIAFLRNITIDPIIPYLKFLCFNEGLKASIYMGEYDNVMQDITVADSPLYQHSPDIIIISVKMEILSEKIVSCFSDIESKEIKKEIDRIIDYYEDILEIIRKNSSAMILVHNFDIPVYPAFGILDYQESSKQINLFRRINAGLVDLVNKYTSTYIVDIELLKSIIGYNNFFDNRYWHIGKAPFTKEALKIISKEYIKFIKALKGRNKKCLVLDCDNTLWGGILGEDGFNKIQIGKTFPGSAYREFQFSILNLYNRGVLLAICSKNNEEDVLEVLENHPDMILRRENFVSMKINWNDKATNIKEVAEELNIGLQSIVFVDDSDFEINLVNKALPEVIAIKLSNDPSTYRDFLNSCGLFDTLSLSHEDRKRSDMYIAEVKRKKAKTEFSTLNLEDYYKYLEMEVSIKKADDFSIPRVAQLTQRTNQFNLTTRRYQESEIRELSDSDNADVFYLSLIDRFGDSGIVGVLICKYKEEKCFIDTFLLSCRVIGRGIEEVLLNFCIDVAKKNGCYKVIGLYSQTKKNGLVKDFYPNHDFSQIETSENGNEYAFSLSEGNIIELPGYFKSIETV